MELEFNANDTLDIGELMISEQRTSSNFAQSFDFPFDITPTCGPVSRSKKFSSGNLFDEVTRGQLRGAHFVDC